MSKPVKRTRVVAKKTSASKITVRPFVDKQGYTSFLVQGWKEEGRWKRKQFKKRTDAERFAALKTVELENQGRSQRMVLSPLSDEQIQQAVDAFDALGSTYSLKEAVRFFLDNHRPPEFTITLNDGIKLYLDDRERDGVRKRTIKQSESVLKMFSSAVDNCMVHQVTPQKVEAFLRGLRAKDGVAAAKRKTWNNYRNDLSHFFAWCGASDLVTQRPWTFTNPVETIRVFSAKAVAEQRDEIVTTTPRDVQHMLSVLMRWRGGIMVKPYTLAYFAGIRPEGELQRLAARADELINLKTGFITIPASVSKGLSARQVKITDNLAAWLKSYSTLPVIPRNWDRLVRQVRKHFKLSHDEARHSFISYHVALNRSIGDAALQAGNSESIVRSHYLNTHSQDEGDEFFRITPSEGRAIIAKPSEKQPEHLRAV